MDNVQDCDSYINIPSSQTYRYNLIYILNGKEYFLNRVPKNNIIFRPETEEDILFDLGFCRRVVS
jgi:hypothetical protein